MKKQTYISCLEDENGKMINFERWSYKNINTIVNKLKTLYQYSIYKSSLEKSKTLVIYETPDGYNKNKIPVLKIAIDELL